MCRQSDKGCGIPDGKGQDIPGGSCPGVTTDTQDTTGTVLDRKKPELSDNDIIQAVASFRGKYMQLPPMYSALRVNGKKLYQLAREGIETERHRREVEIYSAEVLDIRRNDDIRVLLEVRCSKGTYIRTLCADIGDALGCGGCMSFLLRLKAGPFSISDSVTLEELSGKKDEGALEDLTIRIDRAFESFGSCVLDDNSERKFMNGMQVPLSQIRTDGNGGTDEVAGGLMRVYGCDGRFIALGMIIQKENGNYLKVKKFF